MSDYDMKAANDQAAAVFRDVAPIAASFFRSLVSEDMTRWEAALVVGAWIAATVASGQEQASE